MAGRQHGTVCWQGWCRHCRWRTRRHVSSHQAQAVGQCCNHILIYFMIFPPTYLCNFPLIDLHTHHFCTYDWFLIGARAASGTQQEHLCWHLSTHWRPSTLMGGAEIINWRERLIGPVFVVHTEDSKTAKFALNGSEIRYFWCLGFSLMIELQGRIAVL